MHDPNKSIKQSPISTTTVLNSYKIIVQDVLSLAWLVRRGQYLLDCASTTALTHLAIV